jgi:ATP-binding cassette, subfamily B (MDR/TAP), member 1
VAAQSLTQIAPQTIAISKATAAAQDLFAVIDRKSAMDSLSQEGTKIDGFKGEVKLRGLRFEYPSRPDVPVLHGLDLDIPADKTTALVGASGSGKSTIFGILERWYPFLAGSVTLDGHLIEGLNLQWLRTNIRLVQQVSSRSRAGPRNLSRTNFDRNQLCSAARSSRMLWTASPEPT